MSERKRRPVIHIHPSPAAIEALKRVGGTDWRKVGAELLQIYLGEWSDPGTIVLKFSHAPEGLSAAERAQVVDTMERAAAAAVRNIRAVHLLEKAREIAAADPDILRLALRETDGSAASGGEAPPEVDEELREASDAEIIEATRAAHPLAAEALEKLEP